MIKNSEIIVFLREYNSPLAVISHVCPTAHVASFERRVGNHPRHVHHICGRCCLPQLAPLTHQFRLGNAIQAVVACLVARFVPSVERDGLTCCHILVPRSQITASPVAARHGIFSALEKPIAILISRGEVTPFIEILVGERVHVHIARIVVRLEQVRSVHHVSQSYVPSALLDGEEVGKVQDGVGIGRAIA